MDFSDKVEVAIDLAYRLLVIAEHKGWNREVYDYNVFVAGWPEVMERMARMKSVSMEQGS